MTPSGARITPRRVAGRLRRTWQDRSAGGVTHAVTVAAEQRPYLDEALASVRAQTYRDASVVVLGWGPGEQYADIASAREQALATATTPYLRLLEAADTLPPRSTARLVRALRAGSAGTAAGRSARGDTWRDAAFRPGAGTDPGLADRLLDVAAWRSAGPGFDPAHGRFADAASVAADAALGCARIDEVVHEDRDRALGLPFGHLRRWAAEADAWCAAVAAALSTAGAAGATAGTGDTGTAWAAGVLDTRLPALLGDVESLSGAQWRRLGALAADLWALADHDAVRAESRVLGWLTAHGDRAQVTRLVLERWRAPDDLPTEVRSGRVLADLGVDVPDEVRALGERETPLVLVPRRRGPGELDLVAFVRGVSTTEPPEVAATFRGRPVPVTTAASPTATAVAAEAFHDHDHGWSRVALPDGAGPLEVRLTSRGVRRTGTVPVPRRLEPPPHTDPRGDDEIGPRAQLRLQRWYAEDHPIEPDLAYFQSYAGQRPTDSPLAVHAELRRQRPDVRTRWLVEDLSIPVPEGAEPVLLRSREWYATLASARWIVTNIEMERWFRRKPGQEMLQTFHGNPGKAMGIGLWRRMGYTPGRIEQSLDHGPRNWTLLLSPSPAMTRHYREQFDYAGAVLDQGYPRDDVLVGPDAPALRERARAALGIGDRTAVLYAPTWRDERATNYRRATLHEGFDVAAAAAALGEAYVLLLRGHRFHRDLPDIGARVLDVTGHPEVNELLLAADAAVLDYSSIRFDFALTGRPMVFCVPDLEDYTTGRGFLYDFRDSAPGPLLRSTDEVVAALRDLDALEAEYAAPRAAFHQRFNALQDGHAAERTVAAFFGPGTFPG